MKYENTIIHVIHDGMDGEFLIKFSYNPEEDKIKFYGCYGNIALLHGIDFETIIRAAIIQENYVRYIDGESNKEISPEDNHIYLNVWDYVCTYEAAASEEKNKQLKTR